jgi:hypothetical protein
LEVNCGPQSAVIVSGTPKREIQGKVNAFAHAATDISEKVDCFHPFGCVIYDSEDIIKTITVSQRSH